MTVISESILTAYLWATPWISFVSCKILAMWTKFLGKFLDTGPNMSFLLPFLEAFFLFPNIFMLSDTKCSYDLNLLETLTKPTFLHAKYMKIAI